MTAETAWDCAIGMIKADAFEPTEGFKKYNAKENDWLVYISRYGDPKERPGF